MNDEIYLKAIATKTDETGVSIITEYNNDKEAY